MSIKEIAKRTILQKFPSIHSRYANDQSRQNLKIESTKYAIDIIDSKQKRRIRIARRNHALIEGLMDHFDYYFEAVEGVEIKLDGIPFSLVDFSTPRYHDIKGFSNFPVFCPTTAEPFCTIEQYLDYLKIQEGEIILDLGAYCGLTAICFSMAVGSSGRIIALEPDPTNFHAAAKNVSQYFITSSYKNIFLQHSAVAGRSGKIHISAEGTTNSSISSLVQPWRLEKIEVQSISLLDLVELHQLKKIDVIKMDIEGSELALLAESEVFFKTYRPRMVIEAHIVEGVLVTDKLCAILEQYDYECSVVTQLGSCLPLVIAWPKHT